MSLSTDKRLRRKKNSQEAMTLVRRVEEEQVTTDSEFTEDNERPLDRPSVEYIACDCFTLVVYMHLFVCYFSYACSQLSQAVRIFAILIKWLCQLPRSAERLHPAACE